MGKSKDTRFHQIHTELIQYGLKGTNVTEEKLVAELNAGFTETSHLPAIVEALCAELAALYGLDEQLSYGGKPFNHHNYLIELSALLSELGCPDSLVSGPVESRFSELDSKVVLLEFLLNHIKPARLTAARRMREEWNHRTKKRKMLSEALLSVMTLAGADASSSTDKKVSALLVSSVGNILSTNNIQNKPLFAAELSKDEWRRVDEEAKNLNMEFAKRSELLLKRLDVTVESFFWSDRVKRMEKEIMKLYKPVRAVLRLPGEVFAEDIVAAGRDLLIVDKASSWKTRLATSNEISNYMLPSHPSDRGGRTTEMAPLPTETFAGQQRSREGGFGGGGRGRGGGTREWVRGGGGGRGGHGQEWNKRRRNH